MLFYDSSVDVWDILWSLLWLALFLIWILLVFRVFGDIFRSRDIGGWAKALWVLFIVVLPYLGVLIYLIARGRKIAENDARIAQEADAHLRAYIREAAGGPVAELERLAALHRDGAISDEEFASLKAKVVG